MSDVYRGDRIVTTFGLVEALKAEGYALPDHCRAARLLCEGPDEIITLQLDLYLHADDIGKIGRALAQLEKA